MDKLGPGIWSTFHTLCISSGCYDEYLVLLAFINKIMLNLPCNICSEESRLIIGSNIPSFSRDSYPNNANDILFVWSWRMHNLVNVKLGKDEFSITECYELYKRYSGCGCNKSRMSNR